MNDNETQMVRPKQRQRRNLEGIVNIEKDRAAALLRAHLVVDQNLRVVSNDDDTEPLLGGPTSELSISDGHLRAKCANWHAKLEELARTASTRGPSVRTSTSPLGTMRVEVRTLCRHGPRGSSQGTNLVVVKPLTGAIDVSHIARYFRLSRSETKVLDALCRNSRLCDLATRRNVSIHTVRKQLNSALGKLGVHSQVEAVLLVYQTYMETRLAA